MSGPLDSTLVDSAPVDTRRRRLLQGLCATAACAVPGAHASDRRAAGVLTATDVHPQDYPTVAAVRWLGETLQRETGGRLRIRMYHAGQLGRESDTLDMARYGAIDFTRVYTGALNNAFPLTKALCMPFAFDSVAHPRRVHDGAIGAEVLRGFEARGVIGLALYDSGHGAARCLAAFTAQNLDLVAGGQRKTFRQHQIGRRMQRPAGVVETARAAVVQRQTDHAACFETAQHVRTDRAIVHMTLMRHRI